MLGGFVILALVIVVYRPMLPGSFIIDDLSLIKTRNPIVTGEMSPWNIWFRTDFTLSTFVLWLQWLAWGENPGGYHAVNIGLHALSALFLWRLLKCLRISGAWLVAAVFAVHPVCVNSVARIAEIKNTLSLPFFILSFWFYLLSSGDEALHHTRELQRAPVSQSDPEIRRAMFYGLALFAFILALLSKTSTVMLPLVLLGAIMWQRGRITGHDLLRTIPFFALSLAFGLMSIWFQKYQALASAGQVLEPAGLLERLSIAGRGFWFYLGKAVFPLHLNVVYVRWNAEPTRLINFLPLLLLFVLFILCWRFRHAWGRPFLFGLGCFLITLFPALGFFDSQFLTMWQVSDHLQYLPLIAPLALTIGGLTYLLDILHSYAWGQAKP